MSQNPASTPRPSGSLPGLPKEPLSPQEQVDAVKRVHAQAEQRVKVGHELLRVADTRLAEQQNLLQRIQAENEKLRDQVQSDVASSLNEYGRQVQDVDKHFIDALQDLTDKLERLDEQWTTTQEKINEMTTRAEALLDQRTQPAADDSGHPAHVTESEAALTIGPTPPGESAPSNIADPVNTPGADVDAAMQDLSAASIPDDGTSTDTSTADSSSDETGPDPSKTNKNDEADPSKSTIYGRLMAELHRLDSFESLP